MFTFFSCHTGVVYTFSHSPLVFLTLVSDGTARFRFRCSARILNQLENVEMEGILKQEFIAYPFWCYFFLHFSVKFFHRRNSLFIPVAFLFSPVNGHPLSRLRSIFLPRKKVFPPEAEKSSFRCHYCHTQLHHYPYKNENVNLFIFFQCFFKDKFGILPTKPYLCPNSASQRWAEGLLSKRCY